MTGEPLPGALVTGGGARIGRAIALALAAEGRAVAIHYHRSASAAEETATSIRDTGGRAVTLACDFADPEATGELIGGAAAALAALGSNFGLLVNNASLFEYDSAADLSAARFDRHMAVNARAPALLATAFAAQVAAAGPAPPGPAIVNILDQRLHNPDADYLSYTVSKYAAEGLTRTLALALAPDIRVIGIAPGLALPSRDMDEETFAAAGARTPLGHPTAVQDIAATVCYAATARSITGQTILVDAGQHLSPTLRDVAFADAAGQE